MEEQHRVEMWNLMDHVYCIVVNFIVFSLNVGTVTSDGYSAKIMVQVEEECE